MGTRHIALVALKNGRKKCPQRLVMRKRGLARWAVGSARGLSVVQGGAGRGTGRKRVEGSYEGSPRGEDQRRLLNLI